jgi:hypothetical protein
VALEQCGIELRAPHLRTTTKRRIETADVDARRPANDSLRFTGWAPEAIERRVPRARTPAASYAIEAVYVCERDVERVQSMTARGLRLHPPIDARAGTRDRGPRRGPGAERTPDGRSTCAWSASGPRRGDVRAAPSRPSRRRRR